MPGFNINGTGGEPGFGGGPNSLSEVRRKHRWLFESSTNAASAIFVVLKSATRPTFTMEEAVMHHNQEQIYYAGKQSWNTINLEWYDMEQDPDVSRELWNWLNVCAIVDSANVNPPNVYKATVSTLTMRNGLGTPNERWELYNGWPKVFTWGDLSYEDTGLSSVSVEFRYDRASRKNTQ